MIKTYVLDTNVLLADPRSLYAFEDNNLILPMVVIEELDRHKTRNDEVGINARLINRALDDLRKSGNLNEGVTLPTGATLKVETISEDAIDKLPLELQKNKVDNIIIAFMIQHQDYILVSKDVNVRIKCDSLGIKCEDYLKMRVANNPSEIYRGVEVLELSYEKIEEVYATKKLSLTEEDLKGITLYPNQIVVLKDSNATLNVKSAICKCGKLTPSDVTLIPSEKEYNVFGLKPRNKEQIFSLDLLLDKEISLVTLSGQAGCVDPSTPVTIKLNNKDVITIPISNVEDLLKVSDVLIDTPNGYQQVTEFFVKHDKKLYDVLFSDGTKLRCSDDHRIRFSSGEWALVGDLAAAKDIMLTSKFMSNKGDLYIIAASYVGEGIVNDLHVNHPEHAYYANGIVSHNTGKTLLSIAAGLAQLKGVGDPNKAIYDKIIIAKPIQSVGKEIGFLPGTLHEKLSPWISSYKDNLNFLMSSAKTPSTGRKKILNGNPQDYNNGNKEDNSYLSLLMQKGLIEIEAISFIRGRSLPNSYVIIDECQNTSMHEIKTIITRIGEGSKIVLLGDIEQIDNVHVDMYTNGLTNVIERFKNTSLAGHVKLIKGCRSALATLAGEIL